MRSTLIKSKEMTEGRSGMPSIVGLVLARGGSRGIKNKNLVCLEGQPLLLRSLRVMQEARCFSSIWVSTDDNQIAACAKSLGVNVHIRAAYTATDEAPSVVAIQEFLQYHPEISVVCLVQCTAPFLKVKYLHEGLSKMANGYDSVFTVTRKHQLRWTEGKVTRPQNFDPGQRPRRQDWAGDLCETGMFYLTRAHNVQRGILQGGRCGYVEVIPEDSLDIDTPLDLIIAQQVVDYARHKHTGTDVDKYSNENKTCSKEQLDAQKKKEESENPPYENQEVFSSNLFKKSEMTAAGVDNFNF